MSGVSMRPLGELCDILDSKRKPITKRDREAGPFPYYGATGVQDYVAGFLFDEPLVLVGEDGAKWESGESTAFPVDGKVWVNNHAHVLRPDRKQLIDKWLIYYLNFSDLAEFTSGLTVPKLNQASLRGIPVPLPPLAEQRRIVALLDEAFAGIATAKANAEKNLRNARALFDQSLRDVFTRKGRGWVNATLEDVLEVLRNGVNCKQDKSGFGSKISRIESIWNASFDISRVGYAEVSEAQRERFLLKKGDVLFSHINSAIHVGKTALFDLDDEVVHGMNLLLMRTKNDISPAYLDLYMKHIFSNGYWLKVCKQSVNQASVNQQDINRVPFCYPRVERQDEIVQEMKDIDSEARNLESLYTRKLAALDELKQSLLQQAFSGQL